MKEILTEEYFLNNKRELLLDYDIYDENYHGSIMVFDKLQKSLSKNEKELKEIPIYNFMIATRRRSWVAIDILATNYSAGHRLSELRSFYPSVLEYWKSYAKYDAAYDLSETESQQGFAHFSLSDNSYEKVNRMICFAILLGWENLIAEIIPIIDFNNEQKDGMLERMLAFYDKNRPAPPDECLRHLPYFKTLKIFSADKIDRPSLMAEYLEDWYEASRREPYYNAHTRDTSFWGYWSWEAAAITYLLEIDDSSYANAQFYPKDLVDFARQAKKDYSPDGVLPIANNELRAKASDPCPKAGQWQSLGAVSELRSYLQDEPMADLGSAYGLTVWKFIDD
ncbi:PoNe immunity protein domain-containing protein [Janthinobacterium agaricidamnosum]|uniref:PoNi C-terminal domain-containing protein n=1 Tax=Janthinobacterium agaricidamnosum NBRC 102515 = DSM 9628 TaxID=1349767 RepID=W0V742_9BURK|nr:PoNe immunity protein domain-containing protein [Janthinobacterium agaricidamnosum]CDG83168.1 conserved hypothetical protein [Janthinobacterium agaricidamnosum NBRC 102515 = DSM 9628]